MPNIPMKSITGLPGLPGTTYTFAQIDNTLAVAGKAADAKAVGDELADVKADLSDIEFALAPAKVDLQYFNPAYLKNAAVGSAESAQYSTDAIFFRDVLTVKEGNTYTIRITYDSTGTPAAASRDSVIVKDGVIAQLISTPISAGNTVEVTFTASVTGRLDIVTWNRYLDIEVIGEAVEKPEEDVAPTQNANFLQADFKAALIDCLEHIAWTDEHGTDYTAALTNAMRDIASISAELASGYTVYEDQSLYEIKSHITVTVNYTDGTTATTTDFRLEGAITAGESRVMVYHKNFKAALDMPVTAKEALYRWDFTKSNVDTVEQETLTLAGNACLSAHGLMFHRNTVGTSQSTNAAIPMGGRAKIHFGGINMNKNYTAGNGGIFTTPLTFYWRGNQSVDKYSFYYGGAWHDTTLSGADSLEDKDFIFEIEDDGTVNVYCGDELVYTAQEVVTPESTRYISFGCSTSQASLRFCQIESLIIYDAEGD